MYDAGVSEAGRPYLAMEWIGGVPITRYADERRLTAAARAALFQQVLQAVRFAHTRLVIQRDIKPSNILVTADGEVKLLDFGIARLLGEAIASEPSAVAASVPGSTSRALTPEAASPEQLAGEPLATPSDVDSLGVVLRELLCGHPPRTMKKLVELRRATKPRGSRSVAPECRIHALFRLGPPASSCAFRAGILGLAAPPYKRRLHRTEAFVGQTGKPGGSI